MPNSQKRGHKRIASPIALLVVLVFISGGLVTALNSAARAAGNWGTPTEVSGSPGGSGAFAAVSCTDAEDCTAVGGDGNNQPIYDIETAGTWGTPTEVVGSPGGSGSFEAVSCTDAEDCTAVGNDANLQPIYDTETAGTWGALTEIPGSPGGNGNLTGVSCSDATNCTAAGEDGNVQPMYDTETSGTWGAPTELPGTPGGNGEFSAVSCADTQNCTAVGADRVTNLPGGPQPIYDTELAGIRGAPTQVSPPGGSGKFTGVSCTDAEDCTAVGAGFFQQLLSDTELAGSWGTPTEVSGPPLGGLEGLSAVSCSDAEDCTAVGLDGRESHFEPIYYAETAGTWGTPTEVVGSPGGYGAFTGVSCTDAENCTSVGSDYNGQPIYDTSALTVGGTITQTAPTSGSTTTTNSATFTDQLSTTGQSGPVTFVTTSSSSGLSVSSSGAVSTTGTLAVGSYTVSGTDSDAFGNTGTWSYALTVTESPPPPCSGFCITTKTLSNATRGASYSAQLHATGGATPYKWKLISGKLPKGLRLHPNGLLSGTPKLKRVFPGAYSFTVEAITHKSKGNPVQTATQSLMLTLQ